MYAAVFIVLILAIVFAVGWLLATVRRMRRDLDSVKQDLFVMSRVVRDVANGVPNPGQTNFIDEREKKPTYDSSITDFLVTHGICADRIAVDDEPRNQQ